MLRAEMVTFAAAAWLGSRITPRMAPVELSCATAALLALRIVAKARKLARLAGWSRPLGLQIRVAKMKRATERMRRSAGSSDEKKDGRYREVKEAALSRRGMASAMPK